MLALFPPATTRAAPPDVKLEIIPSGVQLAPGEKTDVLIVVRNLSSGSLQEMRLLWFPDAGITVTGDAPEAVSLEPGGSSAWPVQVTGKGGGPSAGEVHFQLTYVWRAADGPETVPGVAVGTLKVQDRPHETIDKIAEAQVETSLDLLQEYRSGIIFLIVRNKSDVPVRVVRVSGEKPDFIDLELPDVSSGVTLAPQESRALVVKATTEDSLQAGKHVLLFDIGLAWEKAGRSWTGSLVATHKLDVGILGESDILKLIGVPSFLLVPGFLMTMAFMMLWTHVDPKREGGKLPLEAKSSEFWLIAITLSLVTAPLYPPITDIFGPRRNYLRGYGLRDVVQVWLGSLAVATLAWLAVVVIRNVRARVRYQRAADQERRTYPAEGDSPVQVLRKLAGLGASYPPELVNVTVEGATTAYFFLAEVRDRVWVAPPVRLEWKPTAIDSIPAGYRRELPQVLDRSGDPGAVAEKLEAGQEWLDVAWEGPRAFDRGQVAAHPNPRSWRFIALA